jgi:hypothetical protein
MKCELGLELGVQSRDVPERGVALAEQVVGRAASE